MGEIMETFTPNEVEKLIEQAYLNGISDAAISKMRTDTFADTDYKKSTAYYEYQKLLQKKILSLIDQRHGNKRKLCDNLGEIR